VLAGSLAGLGRGPEPAPCPDPLAAQQGQADAGHREHDQHRPQKADPAAQQHEDRDLQEDGDRQRQRRDR
jgi:hypothetical protein